MFSLTNEPIDAGALESQLRDPRAGACATFAGWVRNHNEGQAVERLEYEAFAPLARKEGERVLAEARERFKVLRLVAVHRTGILAIGDLAVWVGASSAHREDAFAACRYVIDEVKARLPIWKREHHVGGGSVWINCATRGEHAESRVPPAAGGQ